MVAVRRVILLVVGATAVGVASCAKPTKITLVVTSDMPCAALKGVAITASPPAEVETKRPAAVTAKCRAEGAGSRVGSLVIVPSGATDAALAVRVVAGIDKPVAECTPADGYEGCVVARRILHFVPETELTVTVPLRALCTAVPCDATTTCLDGACTSASIDPAACTGVGCDDRALAPLGVDGGTIDGGVGSDGGSPEGGPLACASDEKLCAGRCVKRTDPHFGCSDGTCGECPGGSIATSVCVGTVCTVFSCGVGYKLCNGNCVPADPAHGCTTPSCTACESTNGTAKCAANGACSIECNAGSKLCGGRCVRIDDPTYGCTDVGCSGTSCPDPGTGTLVCSGNTCVVGACGPNTKKCGSLCVPTDANNGCEQADRCGACSPGDTCSGTPTTCTCNPESKTTTCATKACGPATNNCGTIVDCPDLCPQPNTCGGGGAGKNACGCDADDVTACANKTCGPATNNCGLPITCPNKCPGGTFCGAGGVGANSCCVPDNVKACEGKACGPATNNCGELITCPNTCTGYNKCGGGSAGDNGCGCTVIPKSQACQEPCGSAPNGCGGFYSCGPRGCVPR